jgi:hypothetical protein
MHHPYNTCYTMYHPAQLALIICKTSYNTAKPELSFSSVGYPRPNLESLGTPIILHYRTKGMLVLR